MSDEKKTEEEVVLAGMIRAYPIEPGGISVGLNSEEAENSVVMVIHAAEVALVLPVDVAHKLHDGLCTAIAMLEMEDGEMVDGAAPVDPKMWN